jgi:hypothetical protein
LQAKGAKRETGYARSECLRRLEHEVFGVRPSMPRARPGHTELQGIVRHEAEPIAHIGERDQTLDVMIAIGTPA